MRTGKKAYFIFVLAFFINAISTYALKPIKTYQATPANYGIEFKENRIPSGKAVINSWLLLQKDTSVKKTFIICHHDYGNMSFSLPVAYEMYQRGYNVVLFDYRGFGASSAFEMDSNKLFYPEFVEDFLNVYHFYKDHNRLDMRVYAASMGTIISTIAYAQHSDLFKEPFVYDSFIESLSYTLNYIAKLKHRPFNAPINEATYQADVDKLKAKSVTFFRGDKDIVAHAANSKLTNRNWKVVSFDGGHLQAPYLLKKKMFDAICN
jgi:hypothetical protein